LASYFSNFHGELSENHRIPWLSWGRVLAESLRDGSRKDIDVKRKICVRGDGDVAAGAGLSSSPLWAQNAPQEPNAAPTPRRTTPRHATLRRCAAESRRDAPAQNAAASAVRPGRIAAPALADALPASDVDFAPDDGKQSAEKAKRPASLRQRTERTVDQQAPAPVSPEMKKLWRCGARRTGPREPRRRAETPAPRPPRAKVEETLRQAEEPKPVETVVAPPPRRQSRRSRA